MEWAKTKEVLGLIRYCTFIIDVIFNYFFAIRTLTCRLINTWPAFFQRNSRVSYELNTYLDLTLLPKVTCLITFSTRSARVTIYDFFHLFILSNIFRIHSSVRSIRTKRQQIPEDIDENFSA